MRDTLRKLKQKSFHLFKLYPVYEYLKKVNAVFPLKNLRALEVFAYTGEWQAVAYKDFTSYHEAWEIDADCLPVLKKSLPKAVCKTTDSYEEILKCDKKFNFINIDNHQGMFSKYCEHFEMYPLVFRVMEDECFVTTNVIPCVTPEWKEKYPAIFNEEHLQRRKAFYDCKEPANLTLNEILRTYTKICNDNSYEVKTHVYHQRTLTWYLGLHLKKK